MTEALTAQPETAATDSRKRQQILDGARQVFLEHGYDGASVNDIVRAAGVSKGTVYAYFPSKERVFEALVFEDRRRQAERLVEFADDKREPDEVLRQLGISLMRMLTEPRSIAYIRIVIAATAKFPEVGRMFYEAGQAFVLRKLEAYFRTQTEQGNLRIADPRRAASQFIELCNCGLAKPLLFGLSADIPDETIVETVNSGVDLFMAYYGPNGMSSR